jgi:hypothetical protein
MKRILALAVFTLFPSMLSAAERTCAMNGWEHTGNQLKSDLELNTNSAINIDDLNAIYACRQFALGYLDAARHMGEAGGNFALPAGVTKGQIEAVVLKWAREHPEKLHTAAWGLVVVALREAFPKSQAKLPATGVEAAPGANPAYANYTLCLSRRPGCDCARLSKDKVYWDTVVGRHGSCE